MAFVDLSVPLRDALVSSSGITSLLDTYLNSYPIFTRQPVPDNAPDIGIIISQDIVTDDNDGVNDFQPVITRDILIYGPNDIPAADYRKVQLLARRIHDLFHNSHRVVLVSGWTVVRVTCTGPVHLPQDDQSALFAVTVTVHLAKSR